LTEQYKDLWQEWQKNQEKALNLWKETMSYSRPEKTAEPVGYEFKGLWQEWWNNQEKMMNIWKESLTPLKSNEFMGFFGSRDSLKLEDLYQKWRETMGENFKKYLDLMPNNEIKETLAKMMQSIDVYTQFISFWSKYGNLLPGKDEFEKWNSFSGKWKGDYSQVLKGFFSLFFPAQVENLYNTVNGDAALYQQVFLNLFRPWLESSEELKEKFVQALKGNRESYLDFMRHCQDTYGKTYGRVFNLPAYGVSQEAFGKLTEGLDAYLQYVAAIDNFSKVLYRVGNEAMEKLMKQFVEMSGKEQTPESFKEFYQQWWKNNEQAYLELFQTEGFAKILGETVDTLARFKSSYEDLLGNYYKGISLPNKKDMDSLYETIYQMKKMLSEQAKTIQDLKGTGGEAVI
jgi:class III poly(R)-hydroxyalkanoic acid synthase PhaE subunit